MIRLYIPAVLLAGCTAVSAMTGTPVADISMLMETPPGISVWDGRTTKVIAPSGGQDATPSWTPDGGVIFISDRGGSRQVWKRSAGGSTAQIGSLPATTQAQVPQQGKNGVIIFAAITPTTVLLPDMHHPSNLTIYAMQSDGSGLRELALGKFPSLALSGNWLAFARQTDDPYHHQLYRINIDGTGETQLTFLTDPDHPDANAPSISADETKIAFFSGKEQDIKFEDQSMFTYGYRDLAVIPATGGPRQTITSCKPVTNMEELRTTKSCIVADGPDWLDADTLIFSHMAKDKTDQVISETWRINTDGSGLARFHTKVRGVVPVSIKR